MSENSLKIKNDFGHEIILDKTGKTLTFTDADAGVDQLSMDVNNHALTVNFEKIVLTARATGQSITLYSASGKIVISDGDGDGIVIDKANNSLTISAKKSITVTSPQLVVNCDSIELGNSATRYSLVDARFIDLFNGHKHVISGGTTAAPSDQASVENHATKIVKGA